MRQTGRDAPALRLALPSRSIIVTGDSMFEYLLSGKYNIRHEEPSRSGTRQARRQGSCQEDKCQTAEELGAGGRTCASKAISKGHALQVGEEGRQAAKERKKAMSVYKRGDVWWYKFHF